MCCVMFTFTELSSCKSWVRDIWAVASMSRLPLSEMSEYEARLHGHAGMQAFAAATKQLLPLCDTILEALHFRQGFQSCLTCGEPHATLCRWNGAKNSYDSSLMLSTL